MKYTLAVEGDTAYTNDGNGAQLSSSSNYSDKPSVNHATGSPPPPGRAPILTSPLLPPGYSTVASFGSRLFASLFQLATSRPCK
eukprot:1516515-Pyramimonas_sp.AAC.1